jgi:hypothetical protein
MKPNPYTPADAGCYVDGARGIYSTDAIVDFARDHGATIEHDIDGTSRYLESCDHAETCFDSEFAGCEFNNEFEDAATDWMNDHFPVNGHYWGRAETGDWGLWPIEES